MHLSGHPIFCLNDKNLYICHHLGWNIRTQVYVLRCSSEEESKIKIQHQWEGFFGRLVLNCLILLYTFETQGLCFGKPLPFLLLILLGFANVPRTYGSAAGQAVCKAQVVPKGNRMREWKVCEGREQMPGYLLRVFMFIPSLPCFIPSGEHVWIISVSLMSANTVPGTWEGTDSFGWISDPLTLPRGLLLSFFFNNVEIY